MPNNGDKTIELNEIEICFYSTINLLFKKNYINESKDLLKDIFLKYDDYLDTTEYSVVCKIRDDSQVIIKLTKNNGKYLDKMTFDGNYNQKLNNLIRGEMGQTDANGKIYDWFCSTINFNIDSSDINSNLWIIDAIKIVISNIDITINEMNDTANTLLDNLFSNSEESSIYSYVSSLKDYDKSAWIVLLSLFYYKKDTWFTTLEKWINKLNDNDKSSHKSSETENNEQTDTTNGTYSKTQIAHNSKIDALHIKINSINNSKGDDAKNIHQEAKDSEINNTELDINFNNITLKIVIVIIALTIAIITIMFAKEHFNQRNISDTNQSTSESNSELPNLVANPIYIRVTDELSESASEVTAILDTVLTTGFDKLSSENVIEDIHNSKPVRYIEKKDYNNGDFASRDSNVIIEENISEHDDEIVTTVTDPVFEDPETIEEVVFESEFKPVYKKEPLNNTDLVTISSFLDKGTEKQRVRIIINNMKTPLTQSLDVEKAPQKLTFTLNYVGFELSGDPKISTNFANEQIDSDEGQIKCVLTSNTQDIDHLDTMFIDLPLFDCEYDGIKEVRISDIVVEYSDMKCWYTGISRSF